MANFDTAYNKTLGFEGGYSFDPDDHGGETMMGLTRKDDPSARWDLLDTFKAQTYDRSEFGALYKSCKLSKDFMNSVYQCYRSKYWDRIQGDKIAFPDVANNIFDFGVNSGVQHSIKYAQQVVGVTADGVLGSLTLCAINTFDPQTFVTNFKQMREDYYKAIVAHNPTQQKFLKGWQDRNEKC